MRALSAEPSVKTSQMFPDRCWKTRCFNNCPSYLSGLLVGGEARSHDAVASSQIVSASCVFHLRLYKLLPTAKLCRQLRVGWKKKGKRKSARVSAAVRPGLRPAPPHPPSSVCCPAVMTFMPSSVFGAWIEAARAQCRRDPRRCRVISLCVCYPTPPPIPPLHTHTHTHRRTFHTHLL